MLGDEFNVAETDSQPGRLRRLTRAGDDVDSTAGSSPAAFVVRESGGAAALGPLQARRFLSDLQGCFADEERFSSLVSSANPVAYEVCQLEAHGSDRLLIGWCALYPGTVSDEFFMTKGHNHGRPRPEMYYCRSGLGLLLAQRGRDCQVLELAPNVAVSIPAGWAHRQVNTGAEPLVTVFAVESDAGHDYEFVRLNPFLVRVMRQGGEVVIQETE